MAINFRKLKNNPDDRNIRAIVMNGSESILVYEPSLKNVEEILEAQEGWVSVEEGVNITEEDVLRKLIPMLTNIEGIDEMSDEEIKDVANNPTVALLSVQSEIESIIVEVYRHITVLARRQLQNADFEVETMLAQKESFDRTISMATKYGDDQELPRKLQQAVDNLTAAYRDQENHEEEDYKELLESLSEFIPKEDKEGQVIDLSSVLKDAEKYKEAVDKELDLGESIDSNTTVEDEESKDVYTSDKSKNLTKMIEEKKEMFRNKKSSPDIKLD